MPHFEFPFWGHAPKKIRHKTFFLDVVFSSSFERTLFSTLLCHLFSLTTRIRLLEIFRLLRMERRAWKDFQSLMDIGTNSEIFNGTEISRILGT